MIPGQNFNDRLKAQKDAKLAMLERAKNVTRKKLRNVKQSVKKLRLKN